MSRRGLLSFFPLSEDTRDYSGNNNHLYKQYPNGFYPFRWNISYVPKEIGVFDYDDSFSIGGWFTPIFNSGLNEHILFNNLETISGVTRGYDCSFKRTSGLSQQSTFIFRMFVYNGINFSEGYIYKDIFSHSLDFYKPYHLLITYNGSGASSGINAYFNGRKSTTNTFDFFDQPFANTAIARDFKIATADRDGILSFPESGYGGLINKFSGKVNFFRIHNVVLNQREILDIYTQEKKYLENNLPKSKYIGKTKTASLDLFVSGFDYHNNSTNLVIYGSTNPNWINNFNIYLNGHESVSDYVDLYTLGKGLEEDGINLILACLAQYNENIPMSITGLSGNVSSSVDITILSSANSGVAGVSNLFLMVGEEYSDYYQSIPLFLPNNSSAILSEDMNLFIEGSNLFRESSLPLFLAQSSYLAEKGCTIFLNTQGLYSGFMPYDENIPIYMEINPANYIEFYLAVEGNPINSNINMSLFSKTSIEDSVDLVISNVVGASVDITNLFIRGI